MSIATIKGRVATRIKQFDWEWDNVFAWIVAALLCSTTFCLILYAVVGSMFLALKNFWRYPEGGWPLLTALVTVTVVVAFLRVHYRKHRIKVDWDLGNLLGMVGAILFLTAFGLFVPEMLRIVLEILKNLWRSFLEGWGGLLAGLLGLGLLLFLAFFVPKKAWGRGYQAGLRSDPNAPYPVTKINWKKVLSIWFAITLLLISTLMLAASRNSDLWIRPLTVLAFVAGLTAVMGLPLFFAYIFIIGPAHEAWVRGYSEGRQASPHAISARLAWRQAHREGKGDAGN
jgi:hypothetical protein